MNFLENQKLKKIIKYAAIKKFNIFFRKPISSKAEFAKFVPAWEKSTQIKSHFAHCENPQLWRTFRSAATFCRNQRRIKLGVAGRRCTTYVRVSQKIFASQNWLIREILILIPASGFTSFFVKQFLFQF